MQLPDGTQANVTALANDGNGQVDIQVRLQWPNGAVTLCWVRVNLGLEVTAGVASRAGAAAATTNPTA